MFKEIEDKIIENDETCSGKTFNILYKSVNKVDVDEFHMKCDNKGPTLTVLYGKYNHIFGGYTSENWSADTTRRAKRDEKAFLFYYQTGDQMDSKCKFLPIKQDKADMAITCDKSLGPTFGGGKYMGQYDLQTFQNDGYKRDGKFIRLNGKLNFGCAYGDLENKPQKNDINSGTLLIKRIEVYEVVDDMLQNAWRKKPTEIEMNKMRRRLEKIEPLPGLGIKTYNILLIGVIGSGKSSFYNSLATMLGCSVKFNAPAMDSPTSVTNKINAYTLISKEGKPINIRIFDTRGFEDDRGFKHEIDFLLNGRLSHGFTFPDESKPVEQCLLQNASLENEMHLVCFVTGNSNYDTVTEASSKHIEEITKSINNKGIPMVVVATKFDELCEKISEDADRVYRSPKARDATMAISKHKDLKSKQDGWSMRAKAIPIHRHPDDKEATLVKLKDELCVDNEVLRVLCVGSVKSGKTSFVDSLLSTLRGEIYDEATGGCLPDEEMKDGYLVSTTKKFKMYRIKYNESGNIKESNMYVGDIPGFQENEGIKLEDVKNVILGHVPNNYKIIESIKKDSKKFKTNPEQKDKIHCVCYVFDISTPCDKFSEKMRETLNKLKSWLFEKGIPFVVILTKGDLVSDTVNEYKLNVFENETIKENKDMLINIFKFKENRLFPVINYVHESSVEPEQDALLLSAFKTIHRLSKDNLEHPEDIDESDDDDD